MKPLTDLPRSAAAAPAREQPLGLADLPLRVDAWVSALRMDAAPQDGDVLLRLLEIGFLPGEKYTGKRLVFDYNIWIGFIVF